MKAKIDVNGFLALDRGVRSENWKDMLCPFTTTGNCGEEANCGDWCPHFGDPGPVCGGEKIELCHGRVLIFEKNGLVDERP